MSFPAEWKKWYAIKSEIEPTKSIASHMIREDRPTYVCMNEERIRGCGRGFSYLSTRPRFDTMQL